MTLDRLSFELKARQNTLCSVYITKTQAYLKGCLAAPTPCFFLTELPAVDTDVLLFVILSDFPRNTLPKSIFNGWPSKKLIKLHYANLQLSAALVVLGSCSDTIRISLTQQRSIKRERNMLNTCLW